MRWASELSLFTSAFLAKCFVAARKMNARDVGLLTPKRVLGTIIAPVYGPHNKSMSNRTYPEVKKKPDRIAVTRMKRGEGVVGVALAGDRGEGRGGRLSPLPSPVVALFSAGKCMNLNLTLIPSNFSPQRECSPKRIGRVT